MNQSHAELVRTALDVLETTQQGLANAINNERTDESSVRQSTVCKWMKGTHRVPPINAVAIQMATGGAVTFFMFYPELLPYSDVMFEQAKPIKPALRKKTRPAKPLRNKQEAA